MYNVVFLGAPGAGKGTQAAAVADNLGMAHVATGDLFRKAIASGDELGKQVKSYLEKGQLVPDKVTVSMVLKRIGELRGVEGVILDGFPRTLAQAEALDEAFQTTGETVGRVIYLAVPEKELVKRLSDRWICRAETVQKRLAVYFKETAPLVEYYRDAGSLVEVDGTGEIGNITRRVVAAVKKV